MASLLITQGAREGEYFHLPEEPIVSIGRDDQCTLQLLDPLISRKHLQIKLEESTGRRVASDYRSANGVIINDVQISTAVPLRTGDRIVIGGTTLVYLEEDHPDAKAAKDALQSRSEWKRSTIIRNR